MSRQYLKQGGIVIFREHNDSTLRTPIMKGKVTFEDERADLHISLWKRTDKNGKAFLAGDVQVVIEEDEVPPAEPTDQRATLSDDDIPF